MNVGIFVFIIFAIIIMLVKFMSKGGREGASEGGGEGEREDPAERERERAEARAQARNQRLVQEHDRLVAKGLRGSGLVLASAQPAVGITVGNRRFDQRTVTIDVEVAGRAPYMISQAVLLVPRGLGETVPGSSVELAIDPRSPNTVAVLGPAGFTGPWLKLGPPQSY